jgi:chromate transporter
MSFVLEVLFRFFIAGLFSVGGGMAVIPFFNEMAVEFGWLPEDTLSTIIAVGQSMPGPIGINMATFAGSVILDSFWGGLVASLTLVFPSFIICMFVAKVLKRFKENRFVQMAFYGIRPAVVALIASACTGLFLKALFRVNLFEQTGKLPDVFNFINLGLFAAMLIVNYTVKIKEKPISPIIFIIASAFIGLVFQL